MLALEILLMIELWKINFVCHFISNFRVIVFDKYNIQMIDLIVNYYDLQNDQVALLRSKNININSAMTSL